MSVTFTDNNFSQQIPAAIFSYELPDIRLTCSGSAVNAIVYADNSELCTVELDVLDGHTALYDLRNIVEAELESRAKEAAARSAEEFAALILSGSPISAPAATIRVVFQDPEAAGGSCEFSAFVVYSSVHLDCAATDLISEAFLTSGQVKQLPRDAVDFLPFVSSESTETLKYRVLYRDSQGDLDFIELSAATEQADDLELRYIVVDPSEILAQAQESYENVTKIISITATLGARSMTYYLTDRADLVLNYANRFGCPEVAALRGLVSHSQKSESSKAICSRVRMDYDRTTEHLLTIESEGVLPDEIFTIEQIARTVMCRDPEGTRLIVEDSEIKDSKTPGECASAKLEFSYADNVLRKVAIGSAGRVHTSQFSKEFN